jgi:hypothetical protein
MGPHSYMFSGYHVYFTRGYSGRIVKLTTQVNLELKLIIEELNLHLPLLPSWRAHGQLCLLLKLYPSAVIYCMRSLSGFMNSVILSAILPRNKLFRLGLNACKTKIAVFMHTAHVFISPSVSMCDLYYLMLERRFVNTTSHTTPNIFYIYTCVIVIYARIHSIGCLLTINLSPLKPSGYYTYHYI